MDAVDRRLIDRLRADGRASYAELARTVGLSSSAVHERVAKLEAAGVIVGYRAVVSPSEIGLGVTALVGIEPGEYGNDADIADALDRMPEVESCYAVAGDEAFIVKVRVASVDALHLCLGRLRGIEGVARTRTTVVLDTRFEMRPHQLSIAEPTLDHSGDSANGAAGDHRAAGADGAKSTDGATSAGTAVEPAAGPESGTGSEPAAAPTD